MNYITTEFDKTIMPFVSLLNTAFVRCFSEISLYTVCIFYFFVYFLLMFVTVLNFMHSLSS